jgi:hypothetical protein
MRNYSGSVKDLISTSLFCRRFAHAHDTRAAAYYATARNVFHAAGHAMLVYRLNVLATRTLM